MPYLKLAYFPVFNPIFRANNTCKQQLVYRVGVKRTQMAVKLAGRSSVVHAPDN
jgi:hypothetical protein